MTPLIQCFSWSLNIISYLESIFFFICHPSIVSQQLELQQTGKNHEFSKYHCQLAVEHYVSKGWEREKAEKYVIQRHLSHSSERQDLKKIYLYS